MTREEAKQNLVALGIEEPTDAQVTNYLNQFHNNRPAPAPTPQPSSSPNPASEPMPTPNPNNNNDDLETLRNQIIQLQRENVQKDIRAYATEKGLKGEQADKILASFQDNLDAAKVAIDSMTEIITESNKNAIADYEKKNLDRTANPCGSIGGNGEEKTTAEKIAEKMFSGRKQENNILSHYVGGN